jgi:UPF0755 protein
MIEREAGSDEERDLIASVIYNRLNSDYNYLEIDATIIYAIAGTGEKFSTEVDSPYNTYKYPGLPAGPIASPGIESIKAALYPETPIISTTRSIRTKRITSSATGIPSKHS